MVRSIELHYFAI